MRERPEHEWKVVDIKREMLRRGWAPTPKAVEASVAKLRMLGRIQPIRYGYYRLAPNAASQERPVERKPRSADAPAR